MAQFGSAQREPSMEEILASIRRIIEDSDTGRRPEASEDIVRPDNDAVASVVPVSKPAEPVATVIEVDAFRAELRGEAAGAERPKPASLAEVQAQVAADQLIARQEAEREYNSAPTTPVAEDSATAPLEREAAQLRVAATKEWRLGVVAPEDDLPAEEPVLAETENTLNAVLDDISAEQADSAHDWTESLTTHAVPVEQAVVRPAILSDHAGRQVAAAFGELSDAFAARSKKSFDEIAEEMLRPMLQDWLDNNLPVLVERLVREEIERVARGS